MFMNFFVKAFVVGSHLNGLNLSWEFKMSAKNICLFKEMDKSTQAVI